MVLCLYVAKYGDHVWLYSGICLCSCRVVSAGRAHQWQIWTR